jgi:hypothetical protein
MTHLAFLLLIQYVVSTKAGLVNHVQGEVNVAVTESVAADAPIKTGAAGFAEILLNPGSFLRVGENSEVVIENVELTTIAVRIVSGSVVIEAAGVDKKSPIQVTTSGLTVELIQTGIYVFGDGKAGVRKGKLQAADSKVSFTKGWQVEKRVGYRATKIAKEPTPLELWSHGRSEIMGAMNARAANTYRPPHAGFRSDIWIFSSALGGYTFMPRRHYRSPYGQDYNAFFIGVRPPGREGDIDAPRLGDSSPGVDRTNPGGIGVADGVFNDGGFNTVDVDDRQIYESIREKNIPVPAID